MSDLEDRVERLEAEYRDISNKWVRLSDDDMETMAYVPIEGFEVLQNDCAKYLPFSVSFEASVVDDESYNRSTLWVSEITVVNSHDVPNDWTLRQ